MNKLTKALISGAISMTIITSTAFAAAVPVRSTFENMGFTVEWEQETKTVTLTNGSFTFQEAIGENFKLENDTTTTTEEYAASIVNAWKKEALSDFVTVTEINQDGSFFAESEKLGEVIFKTDENTNFHHEMNRMAYRFESLEVGKIVKVYYAEAMTMSLPPQVYATEVVFLNEVAVEEVSLTKTGKITEIGEGYFVIETGSDEFQFNCDEQTNIHHIMNRRMYRFEDLEKDMEVEVIHSDAMTMSLPPQMYAIEVIIK